MRIDRVTMRRLLYVKQLFIHGQEHMTGTEFERMFAILHFDNAIELLLKSVAASYDISISPKVTFPELWNRVNEKYKAKSKAELPRKTEVFHLHGIRSDVQHWGSPFSLDILKEFDECTQDFLKTILESVFGLRYDELFLSSLITDEKLRALLTEAERCFHKEKWKDAIEDISKAFVLAREEARKRRDLSIAPEWLRPPVIGSELGDTDERVELLALDLDFEEYRRFKKNTPAVIPLEPPVIQWIRKYDFNRENTLFCLNFALKSILKWGL